MFFGIRFICGGLPLYASMSQYSCQSAGNVPLSFPWDHILAISKALLFASTSQSSNLPSFFFCKVDIGTLKIEPCHMNHFIADMICLLFYLGRGKTWAVCHILASK